MRYTRTPAKLIRSAGGLQLPLPGVSRSKAPVAPKVSEEQVQQEMIDKLPLWGLRVDKVSRSLKREQCPNPKCGWWFWPVRSAADGTTKGLQDIQVRREDDTRFGRRWPTAIFLTIEVKPDEKARVRPEQKIEIQKGNRIKATCIEEVLRAVEQVEEEMRRWQ